MPASTTLQDFADRYCTISEAAQMLGVSYETVRKWVLRGRLSGRKVGHLTVVERADVSAVISGRRVLR